jgi:hypothetical protein
MHDFDVVIPNKNEDAFIDQALALGYREIVFLTQNISYSCKQSDRIRIKTAYLVDDVSDVSRARKKFDYIFAPAERKYFEWKSDPGIDFIVGAESSDRRDSFHYKATGLNQVHAELVKSNGLTVVFAFSKLSSNPFLVKGRMLQNARLVNKYKLKYSVFTLAADPNMMRSRNILDSLAKTLGMH